MVVVAVVGVRFIDGLDPVAAHLDSGLLHHSPAMVLHHNPVGVCRVQTDSEGQASRSRHNYVMSSEVGKVLEKLLVLVYCLGVVRNRETLSHPLDVEMI